MRVAIYARYSDDIQDARSIDDQVRLCREHAKRAHLGEVVEVFADHALSGTMLRTRPDAMRLLAAARNSAFDTVLIEALDRISRDQEDIAYIFKRLRFACVSLVSVSEGEINELHIGLKGTVNAIYSKDLAAKVRRGQAGRAASGTSPGGLSFGYRVVRRYDHRGEPERGLREIDESQAAIIRRIYADYAAGLPPRAIAKALNAEGVPSPRGGQWNGSTIAGGKGRATGILWNEAYTGRIVYNRTRFSRDPDTGKRISRPNSPEDYTVGEAPELRIIDDMTWEVAQRRHGERSGGPAHLHRRPKHAFSGLVRCAQCGSSYTVSHGDRLGCTGRRERGGCDNSTTVAVADLEYRVLAGLRARLLAADLMQAYIAEYHAECARLRAAAREQGADRRRRLAQLVGELDRLVDAIAKGLVVDSIKDRILTLEAERRELEVALAASQGADVVELHPKMIERYRARIAGLTAALAGEDGAARHAAIAILREFVDHIEIGRRADRATPAPITAFGLLPQVLAYAAAKENKRGAAGTIKLVAGGGFEPPTFGL
jgi:site-specific DNA recombinase